MNISEAMAAIAEEARQQGFLVSQTRSGMWRFGKDNHQYLVSARTVEDLLDILSVLIAAGLDWSHHWD